MENPDAGFTLCYHIRKQDASLPVILVTSVNSETGLDFDLATDEERSWIKIDGGRSTSCCWTTSCPASAAWRRLIGSPPARPG
jgi:hypothetical protein